MNSKQTCLLLLLGLTAAATPDQFFAYDNIEHQSGGNFEPNPMGFWSDANGTYAANLELPDRSRWVKVGNSAAENRKTSEASPQLSPLRVLGVNASGECCGWTKTSDAVNGPCKWSAGSLANNILPAR